MTPLYHQGYSLTFFSGHVGTLPTAEYTGLSAATIIERVAPDDGPRIIVEKKFAPHFLTCPLKVAPYIQKTALRFRPGAQGKQRSLSHVTESAWFAFDFDGIRTDDKAAILSKLVGKVYVAYSTHSHGTEAGKVRMRITVFLDRALAPAAWTAVWHAMDHKYFGDRADKTTTKMHQLAAVWVAHPDREACSFRHVGKGEPLSADAMLALAPKPAPQRAPYIPLRPMTPGGQRGVYADALLWIDAGDCSIWQSGLMWLFAAVEVGALDDAEGRDLWLTWTATASAAQQARNGQSQYSPEAMWDRKPKLTTPAAILVSSLFAKAKAAAIEQFKSDPSGTPNADARRAGEYLRRHHRATYRQLKAG